MSLLVILLPPRPRLGARGAAAAAESAPRPPETWRYVFSSDGLQATQADQAAAALLPRATRVVLALAEGDVAWHRVQLPKAPPARLRAALAGVLEEALLDDDEALHLALGPGAVPGAPGWVAAVHRAWLAGALAALEGAGVVVDQVVPMAQPLPPGSTGAEGHFFVADGEAESAATLLTLAREDGVSVLRLAGGLARALVAAASGAADAAAGAVRWTATPAAAAAAEQWLGAPVALQTEAERALHAARVGAGGVNLRQFDLVPRRRGTLLLREAARRLLSPEWRPVRWGLAALLVVQLVGLNAYAWQQRQAIADKRAAMNALLREAHPGVRAVLDAPLQMQRETERLRAAAGRPGDSDLEVLLAASAAAWPDGQGPVQALRFEAGRLTLAAPGFGEPQLAQFRQRLRGAGFSVELTDGRLTVARGSA